MSSDRGRFVASMVRGHVEAETPERRLALAIVEQAVRDALEPVEGKPEGQRARSRWYEVEAARRSALRFLWSHDFEELCYALGTDPEYVWRLVRKSLATPLQSQQDMVQGSM